ncbi:MAG: translation initiation factor [Nitrospiraceae bacterium]|nr:translation initiation factor [Nitrospiraceae bacterium]
MPEENSRLVYSTDRGKIDGASTPAGAAAPAPTGASAGRKNKKLKLHLRLERKGRGGKTVTLVCGLGLAGRDMDSLLKALKGLLGTGGALKEDTLELQGDHRDAITAILREKGHRI